MADRRPHLEIPNERVTSSPIRVRGRSKPFTRPNYSAHGDFLRERAAAIRQYADSTADSESTDSLFLQVQTPEELPAVGEKMRLRNAGLEVVALSTVDPNSATVQMRKRDLPQFQGKVERYARSAKNIGKSYMSVIEDLRPVPDSEKIDREWLDGPDEVADCLLLFYSTLTERERAEVLFAVRSYMARRGAELGDQRRLSNGVTLVEARLRPSEAREVGGAFSTLRQITPDRVFVLPDSWRISPLPPDISVESPSIHTAVAVIDTGVSGTCPPMAGTVADTIPFLPSSALSAELEHGTFVGSRVVYGDRLEEGLRRGHLQPICPLVDVPVIGKDGRGRTVNIHEGHLVAAIDSVLPQLPPYARVVNISLGTGSPTSDGTVSLIGQLLDKHARERDLVVITTAGNIRDPQLVAAFPEALTSPACRIDSPGDSLLAVTVGSIAKYVDDGAMSRPGELSAFSRRGPGPFGGIKPDLVAHGGNCFADGTTNARIATHGLLPSGQSWACDYGTSFAAPLVSGIAAQLSEHYGDPKANLIRALLLHFTNPVISPTINVAATHLVGLGEPDMDAAKWSQDHAAAFVHVGELQPSHFTFLPFWVPACLAAGGGGKLRIKVTVVIDPPVSPDNPLEYAKSRITLALRKPAEVGHAQVGVSQDLVDVDRWCPVNQLERRFHRSYQTGEWQLQIRLWTRNLDADYRQGYAAVVEVIDDTQTLPVREDVEREGSHHFRAMVVSAAA